MGSKFIATSVIFSNVSEFISKIAIFSLQGPGFQAALLPAAPEKYPQLRADSGGGRGVPAGRPQPAGGPGGRGQRLPGPLLRPCPVLPPVGETRSQLSSFYS